MEPILTDHLDRLLTCRSREEAWRTAGRFFAAQGQPWICYGTLPESGVRGADPPAVRSNLPPDYLDRWMTERFYARDPWMKHVRRSVRPGLFGPEFMDRERDGQEVWACYEGIREIGACSNVTVPLRSETGRPAGFIVLGGARKRPDLEQFVLERGQVLVLAADLLHARLQELTLAEHQSRVRLTPRERECLSWLSAGLKNTAISERMGAFRKRPFDSTSSTRAASSRPPPASRRSPGPCSSDSSSLDVCADATGSAL